MKIESQWAAEALYRTWEQGVQHFFWFSLVDFNEPGVPFPVSLQSGLYFWAEAIAAQQPKEVLFAFRFPFVAFARRNGLFYWGRTGNSHGGRVLIQARRHGRWRLVDIAHADRHGMFTGTAPVRYGRDRHGAVRARYGSENSLGFPMKRVGDFPHAPFG